MQRYTDQQTVRPTIENQGRKSNKLTEKSKSHKKTKFMNSNRQIHSQINRETDRKRDRQTDHQTVRQTERETMINLERQCDNDKQKRIL